MLYGQLGKVIVYAGPSAELFPDNLLNQIDLRPPIKREDLSALLKAKAGTCIIIDGIFFSNLAITPYECKLMLENGWCMVGCSSMGALRAADLWSQGMIGMGSIFHMYRLGLCKSDAEVTVIYTKNGNKHIEATVSLVHIRAILQHLEKNNKIDELSSRKLLKKAKEIIWYNRSWKALRQKWREENSISVETIIEIEKLLNIAELHPKKIDALNTLKTVLARRWIL